MRAYFDAKETDIKEVDDLTYLMGSDLSYDDMPSWCCSECDGEYYEKQDAVDCHERLKDARTNC